MLGKSGVGSERLFLESPSRHGFLSEHDSPGQAQGLAYRKPRHTFWDHALTAGRLIHKNAALGYHGFARLKALQHLNRVAVGDAGLDLARFDSLVLARHPDLRLVGLVDHRAARH